jgi:PKD repeat protein
MGAAQHLVYTYTQPGVFTVTLTVTDTKTGEGDTAVEAQAIHAVGPTVITYTYDSLNRLAGAEYSTARASSTPTTRWATAR